MAEDKAIKKAAQDSISRNNHSISSALQSSPTIFQQVVEKCAAEKIISPGEKNTYLDTYTGQSLAHRTSQLVSNLQRTVGVVPNTLDDILCIFHESENLVVQEAAKTIAKDCKFYCINVVLSY
uniref:Uncharacterized protein n=1 Tax=Amphimedon queenslandica TaxID=400682 RepID=A0A1X7SE10_AMPQE